MANENQISVGVGVFVIKDGNFLMIKRKGSEDLVSWTVPSSYMAFGETPIAAASKIVMEKTGLVVNDPRVIGVTNEIYDYEKLHRVMLWVVANWQVGDPLIRDDEAIKEINWFNFESLPSPLSNSWSTLLNSKFIEDIKAQLSPQ